MLVNVTSYEDGSNPLLCFSIHYDINSTLSWAWADKAIARMPMNARKLEESNVLRLTVHIVVNVQS